MNRKILIFLLFMTVHCSFDNKTGIWSNENEKNLQVEDRFKDFKTLYTDTKPFNSKIKPPKNLQINLDPTVSINKWSEKYYRKSNNLDNFKYNDKNNLIFKSKKLSRFKIKDRILFYENNVISNDIRGNLIVYSLSEKKIIFKYNFYKKSFRKIDKDLFTLVENNVAYIFDNLGFSYAINLLNKKLLWAKNHKIPFRSNVKISNDKIIIADQNNSLHFLDKFNGKRLKIIPTEETILKNQYVNSLSSDENTLFFLNTYGSLYSISQNDLKINWFSNFNQSLDMNPGNLFFSNPIILHDNMLVISTDPFLYIVNSINGSIIYKLPITSIVKPIISGKYIFLITKDNLLVCIDLISGKINYSIDIGLEIANYLNSKNKTIQIKSMSILNSNLFIFLNNSYVVQFNKIGNIKKINKLPDKLGTFPIFISKSIMYLNKKNKLVVVN